MKHKSPKHIIKNTSNWPDPFVNVIVNWVLNEVGVDWNHKVIVRHSDDSWSGTGDRWELTVRMDRRYSRHKFPWKHRDHRFKWSAEFEFLSRVEVFVYLLAHEAKHSLDFHEFKNDQKRDKKEFYCNDVASNVVKKFRKEWPILKVNVKKLFAKELKAKKRKLADIEKEKNRKDELKKKQKERKVEKRTPQYKLEKYTKLLDKWKKQLKTSQDKVKFYKAKVKHFQKKVGEKNE